MDGEAVGLLFGLQPIIEKVVQKEKLKREFISCAAELYTFLKNLRMSEKVLQEQKRLDAALKFFDEGLKNWPAAQQEHFKLLLNNRV